MSELVINLLDTLENNSDEIVSFHFIYNGDNDTFQVYVSDADDITSYYPSRGTSLHHLNTSSINEAVKWVKDKRIELTKPKTKLVHGKEVPNISLEAASIVRGESCYLVCITEPEKVIVNTWRIRFRCI